MFLSLEFTLWTKFWMIFNKGNFVNVKFSKL
jgi:hypothetical protein